jgi:hypothetical protein
MDNMIKFDSVIGVLILLATVAILLLVAVISFIKFVSEAKSSSIENKQGWSKYFLLSAILFLLFDGAFFLFLQRDKTFDSNEGATFDNRMAFIWIPCHIIGYFFVVYALHFFQLHKIKINKFFDRLR